MNLDHRGTRRWHLDNKAIRLVQTGVAIAGFDVYQLISHSIGLQPTKDLYETRHVGT
jgi:hypothetical protein